MRRRCDTTEVQSQEPRQRRGDGEQAEAVTVRESEARGDREDFRGQHGLLKGVAWKGNATQPQ